MAEYSKDYVAGWKDARGQYQMTGGVQPYPPGYQDEPEPEPEAPKKASKKAKED